jgi:uncharacterized protein (DUF1778 family)
MASHGERAHATWSASASERNFACPGALALIESLGIEDRETEPAAWGTACHQVAERCFRENKDAAAYIGSVEKTKKFSFTFDDEMAECTQVFLDYVRERLFEYSGWEGQLVIEGAVSDATMLLEQKFDLAPIDPPFQAGGTGDVVLLFPAWGLIEVVDLKTGKKWVEAVGNKQLRTYGLGAAIANPGAWETIKTTIVQPRVGGNPVRSEEMSVADLLDWTVDLKEAMHACGRAFMAREIPGWQDWEYEFLRPGDHCRDTFCPAAGRCPAIQKQAMELARVHFQPVGGEISAPPDPKTLPVDKIVAVLDAADMIETWLNGVRAYGREIVEGGGKLPTPDGEEYHLVDKQGRRAWAIDDEDELLRALAKVAILSREDFVVEKVKSPAQAEAYIAHALSITKEKAKALIADLCPAKSSGQNLVRSNKTKREKALPPAEKFFTAIPEIME